MGILEKMKKYGDHCVAFKELFYEKIAESLHRTSSGRKKEVHISNIKASCKRNQVLRTLLGFPLMRQKSTVKVWIGNRVHDFPILEKHELRLEWEGIIGTVDEYEDGILIDKKTCRKIPKRPYPDHVIQVEYYSILLMESGHPVMEVGICYIDVNDCVIEVLPVDLKRDIQTVKEEMLEARDELLENLENKTLPEREWNWLCEDYCELFQICFLSDDVLLALLGFGGSK